MDIVLNDLQLRLVKEASAEVERAKRELTLILAGLLAHYDIADWQGIEVDGSTLRVHGDTSA